MASLPPRADSGQSRPHCARPDVPAAAAPPPQLRRLDPAAEAGDREPPPDDVVLAGLPYLHQSHLCLPVPRLDRAGLTAPDRMFRPALAEPAWGTVGLRRHVGVTP